MRRVFGSLMKSMKIYGSDGFTSIEMIISSVVLGLVVIVSFGFWKYFTDSYDFSFGKSNSQNPVLVQREFSSKNSHRNIWLRRLQGLKKTVPDTRFC